MEFLMMFKPPPLQSFRNPASLSIAVHVVFFLFFSLLVTHQSATHRQRRTTLIDLEPYPVDISKKSLKTDQMPDKRIVQTAKAAKSAEAAPDAFLGEQNQKVDRQTVSRERLIKMGKAAITSPSNDLGSKEISEKTTERAKPLAPSPALIPLQSLGLSILPTAQKMEKMAQEKTKSRTGDEFVTPSEQAPQDYIKGMKEGEATALNTREFMFYGYYQRIRERLDRAWVPLLRANVMSLYNHGRHLASEMDYSTKLMVVMNTGGEIIRIQVLTESGTNDLDDAAVEAFNKAGPFPNPPHGIVDSSGEIKIPWEFVLRT